MEPWKQAQDIGSKEVVTPFENNATYWWLAIPTTLDGQSKVSIIGAKESISRSGPRTVRLVLGCIGQSMSPRGFFHPVLLFFFPLGDHRRSNSEMED